MSELVSLLLALLTVLVVGVPAYCLGRQSAQIEAERERDELWEREHP